jgi:hypothetical protein
VQDEGQSQRLRIYISEGLRWQGKSVAQLIVHRAQEFGIAGVTVLRGIEGFGVNRRVHTSHMVEVDADLPLIIEAVDRPQAISRLLGAVDAIISEGLVTLEDVTVVERRPPAGS